jgi:predicted AAA+ superfamily ATPase
MISRKLASEVSRLAKGFRVIAVTGPRQSGKTTLCKLVFPDYRYFNLENPTTIEEIKQNPKEFLGKYAPNGIIFDEAQKYPELFSYIQVIADENPDYRFVLTGSSNFMLLEKITQSLAGRIALLTLLPLSFTELKDSASNADTDTLLFKGGFPAIWGNGLLPQDVIPNYYNTYIERDVRQIINVKDMSRFQIFIRLCAGRAGKEFNASELANEVGVSFHTIQEWLSVLEASYIIFRLKPFYKNIGKRLIKTPKIYFYDTGILCFLLGIENEKQLQTHPLRGEIFENFVLLEFVKGRFNQGKSNNLLFYKDQSKNEIDIVQEFAHQYKAYEVKSATAYHSDFAGSLKYLKKILDENLISTKVIYDGKQELDINDMGYVNFRNMKDTTES